MYQAATPTDAGSQIDCNNCWPGAPTCSTGDGCCGLPRSGTTTPVASRRGEVNDVLTLTALVPLAGADGGCRRAPRDARAAGRVAAGRLTASRLPRPRRMWRPSPRRRARGPRTSQQWTPGRRTGRWQDWREPVPPRPGRQAGTAP